MEILKGLRPYYESHHQVQISDEALEAAARLSDRYVNDRFLPDKAIDLMDEAAAGLKLGQYRQRSEQRRLYGYESRSCWMQEQALDQALMDVRSGESPQSCKDGSGTAGTCCIGAKREPAAGERVPTL